MRDTDNCLATNKKSLEGLPYTDYLMLMCNVETTHIMTDKHLTQKTNNDHFDSNSTCLSLVELEFSDGTSLNSCHCGLYKLEEILCLKSCCTVA